MIILLLKMDVYYNGITMVC